MQSAVGVVGAQAAGCFAIFEPWFPRLLWVSVSGQQRAERRCRGLPGRLFCTRPRGELVTKVKGVMVERRHSLGGRGIWGVWGLECTGWWRGLRRVRQDLRSPRTEQNKRPLLLP